MNIITTINMQAAREQVATMIWDAWTAKGGSYDATWEEFWSSMKDFSLDVTQKAMDEGLDISKARYDKLEGSAWNCAYDAFHFHYTDVAPKSEDFWKEIDGYSGAYSVNYWGEVRSNRSGIRLKQRIVPRGKGYWYVSLWQNNKEKKYYVHRLVAQAFIPNPDNKATVNHKDGNTDNNAKKNLEWMTHREQQDHAWATGLTDNRGENCGTSKLTGIDVAHIREVFSLGGVTQSSLAKKYGVSQGQISKIVNDKRWSMQ